ncbi:MAG: NAD-dependent epimerase/dehydratase family protein, partial [Methylocystis sp.]|nr:NAD-dependent epimerase/dehydratase family protein [Methylocystis sp.]
MAAYERIFLTGGAGFVGGHLAAALAAAYPQAKKTMLLRPGEGVSHPAFAGAEADLVDEAAIDVLVARLKPDLVCHLAGQASIGDAARAAEMTWRVNFHGTFGLAAALARHAPRAVTLFTSTAAVYGLSFRDGALSEEAPLRPLEVYSRSKVAAENALADVLPEEAKLIIARPVNHSGPGQRGRSFVLSTFAAQIAAIESGRAAPRLKVGDLTKARDFLDVRDVVDAYMRLIARARQKTERVGIFNIGSGEARTIQSLLDELRARSKRRFEVEVDPALLRPSATDIPSIACSCAKLTSAT